MESKDTDHIHSTVNYTKLQLKAHSIANFSSNCVILAVKRRRRRLVDERVQPVKLSTYDQHRFMLSRRHMKVQMLVGKYGVSG
ncbi:hypothetical protein C5167_050668 [Papaver somniferum]|uniref:Uncharacterized protein n=1 Tax=Papaver somniferum TaxID=3469 RepID=A0A4Y7KTI6_PAPSO|nr:hypothetical protein C5167_050668 [Papaver somniferum]